MMLKDQKDFYKVCFDSMQMGILVCDKNKSITYMRTININNDLYHCY